MLPVELTHISNPMAENSSILNRDFSFRPVFPDKVKEQFYSEFGALLENGVDIQQTIEILIEEEEDKGRKELLENVRSSLISGSSLSVSLGKFKWFSNYELQSIKIGEETGKLKEVLVELAAYFSSKVKLKRQLISVFTYPSFVLLITFGVLYFMLNNVVPMFEDVFKQFGQELPFLTQKIIGLSKFFSAYFVYMFLGVLVIIIYLYSQRAQLWFRKTSASVLLRLPIFGPLFHKIYLARTCQSLSLLLSAKTPLVQALELVKDMIRFYPIENALEEIKQGVIKGESFYKGLSAHPIFEKKLISLTKIAEETNQLEKTYQRLASQYQEEIEYKTKLLGTLMEPIIIVLIGTIVGIIMVAMYLPMFNLSNVIQ